MTRLHAAEAADLLSRRLHRAAGILPSIRDHLDDQRTIAGTSASSGDGGRQGGTHSDPTLAAVGRLDDIDQRWRVIIDAIESINVGVNILDEACRDALGTRARPAERSAPNTAASDEPKCDGGDESTWGDPQCGQIINWAVSESGHVAYDPDGLCPRHLARRSEWRQEQAELERLAEESNARRRRRYGSAA